MKNFNPKTSEFPLVQSRVEEASGYTFKNGAFFWRAMCHSSYYAENLTTADGSNERLEFLGDAVLELAVSRVLFDAFPELQEGQLTVLRARLVDGKANAGYAVKLGLDKAMLLGNGADATGGRENQSLLNDVFEAFLGAVYLDGGFAAADGVVKRLLPPLEQVRENNCNYKGDLQQYTQKELSCIPRYFITSITGATNNAVFQVEVRILDQVMGQGTGSNRRGAEQLAAKEALAKMAEMAARGEKLIAEQGAPQVTDSELN